MLSPRGRSFGLGLKHLASAWPRSRCLIMESGIFGQKSCKIRAFVNFSDNNLKSYVVDHYLVIFHNYFCPRPWPQPPEIGLGLGLIALASASASRFWPRLTSLL